jgi:hypothetical protein
MNAVAEWANREKLEALYPQLVESSQRMMLGVMRKFRIEEARRVPAIQGYELWSINDPFSRGPLGSLWDEGVLDYF